jgi:hypothetical protein
MALENVNYVTELVQANPPGTDVIAEGDNHIRLIKKVLKLSFPDVDRQAATIIVKSSAPATQIKGTIWYDTGNNLLKINTADDAATPTWVTINLGAPWASSSPASDACFRAHRNNVSQDMAATTDYQLVEFTHEDFDEGEGGTAGGDFVVEAGGSNESRFVIQSAGAGKYYLHTAILETTGTGDDDVIAIFKNGALEAYTNAFAQYSGVYGSVSRTRNVSCIVDAVASDYFEVFYQTEHNQGDADIVGSRTGSYFEGYKIA